MQICILNKNTRQCINIFEIQDESQWRDHGDFIRAPRDDGFIGWILNENNEWIDPNPPVQPPQPSDEEKWEAIRLKRDKLLTQTDFIMLPDSPYTDAERQAWATFRQQLRDLPDSVGNPDDVVWPVAP